MQTCGTALLSRWCEPEADESRKAAEKKAEEHGRRLIVAGPVGPPLEFGWTFGTRHPGPGLAVPGVAIGNVAVVGGSELLNVSVWARRPALDKKCCQRLDFGPMVDVEVIESPAVAVVALDPVRSRLLGALTEARSAAMLAQKVGLTRQKVTYHLNALEKHGLIRTVGKRQWGGLTERLFVSTAASYIVAPGAMGDARSDPVRASDRLSAAYLIAIAARTVQEVGDLIRHGSSRRKHVATLSIDTAVRFRNADQRSAFADELAATVRSLAARYHDAASSGGRWHRVVIGAYPLLSAPKDEVV